MINLDRREDNKPLTIWKNVKAVIEYSGGSYEDGVLRMPSCSNEHLAHLQLKSDCLSYGITGGLKRFFK